MQLSSKLQTCFSWNSRVSSKERILSKWLYHPFHKAGQETHWPCSIETGKPTQGLLHFLSSLRYPRFLGEGKTGNKYSSCSPNLKINETVFLQHLSHTSTQSLKYLYCGQTVTELLHFAQYLFIIIQTDPEIVAVKFAFLGVDVGLLPAVFLNYSFFPASQLSCNYKPILICELEHLFPLFKHLLLCLEKSAGLAEFLFHIRKQRKQMLQS